MQFKGLFVLVIFLSLGFTSNADSLEDKVWPEPRPLGKDIKSYRPLEREQPEHFSEIEELTGTITLSQALSLALLKNPQLRASSWEVQAGQGRSMQARLYLNPELAIEMEGVETTAQLSQQLELGGKVSSREEVANLEQQLAGWEYESKRLDVITQVTQAFTKVASAQLKLKLMDSIKDLTEEIFNTISERVRAGKDSPTYKIQSRIEWRNAKIQFRNAERDLKIAKNSMAILWGSPSAKFEGVEGTLDDILPIPPLDQLLTRILKNPNLARWSVAEARSHAALRLAESMRWPDLTIAGGMRRNFEDDETIAVLGISLPLQVFDRNQGRIFEVQSNLTGIRLERKAAELSVRNELTAAYETFVAAFTEATTLKDEILPDAEAVFEAAREGYRFGKFGYLEMLTIQRTFVEVKLQYIDATAEYHQMIAEVERLVAEPLHSQN